VTSRPFLELRATCAPRDTVERNPEREDRNRCEDAEPEVGARETLRDLVPRPGEPTSPPITTTASTMMIPWLTPSMIAS